MRRIPALLTSLFATGLTAALVAAPQASGARPAADPPSYPALSVTTVASGLDLPWDVKPLPDGHLLITERASKRLLYWNPGTRTGRSISYERGTVWAKGETGLMGLAVDPSFASNRRFYTCQGGYNKGKHDVKVMAWTLSSSGAKATRAKVLLRGIPATSGRHGGCRLLITSYGALMVGTGDAAIGTNAHNRKTLGGKTLRMNRFTGKPWSTNPFKTSKSAAARLVVSYGHRNVQGLTQRPWDDSIWSVEHGTSRDDEVNRITRGWDYGWNPVPGYNESRPMTDHGLPGTQHSAKWRSGNPTIATSGADWTIGSQWGDYNGMLAVGVLKGERLLFMRFTKAGSLVTTHRAAELNSFGRLRSVTRLPNGDLLVTTSNGGGADKVLRVRPSA